MKNYNYNLIKMLHCKLDDLWRIEKHYLGDAEGLDCDCAKVLEEIRSDSERHIKMLKEEIKKHLEKEGLD
jgi:hypothetical protein